MAGQADSLKSILFALFANSAIAVAKGVYTIKRAGSSGRG